mgnify:CR=1 FL=1|jgi:hypothetical protein
MAWALPDLDILSEICRHTWLQAKTALSRHGVKDHFETDYELRFALFLAENIDGLRNEKERIFHLKLTKGLGWTPFHLKLLDERIQRQPSFDVSHLRLPLECTEMATALYLCSLSMCLIDGDFHPDEKDYLINLRRHLFPKEQDGRLETEKVIQELFSLKDDHEDFFEPPPQEIEEKENVETLLQSLDALIGLDGVKEEIKRLISFLEIQKKRKEHQLPETQLGLHMVYTGNPGTGKTTVARLVARIFRSLDILKKGHLVETDRSGLVGQYVGHTEVKTNEIINKALDGILFIDEAYALVKEGSENDFGKEAVDTLVKRMEDDRHRLIVIVAGYRDEMETFLSGNVGLKSRFNTFIDFENYTPEELVDILRILCDKNGYELGDGTESTIKKLFSEAIEHAGPSFGNGRFARNLFEGSLRYQAFRLSQSADELTKKDLLCLMSSDFEQAHGQRIGKNHSE